MSAATGTELLVIRLARVLDDGMMGFIGAASAVQRAAFRLAQELGHSRLSFLELGGQTVTGGATIDGVPRAPAGTPTMSRDLDVMIDLVDWKHGMFDVAMLSGLQLDRHGNVNTIGIGDYAKPSLRGPGIIGAGAIAALVHQIHLIAHEHSARTLVDQVAHCSAFGHAYGDRTRPALGLRTAGPVGLHTPLASFTFEGPAGSPKSARLREVVAGVSAGDLAARTGFELIESGHGVRTVAAPATEELAALRALPEAGLLRTR